MLSILKYYKSLICKFMVTIFFYSNYILSGRYPSEMRLWDSYGIIIE
jgi:hypothetical protein